MRGSEPLAEQREDLHRLGAQRCFLGLDRARAHQRERKFGDRTDQRPLRAHRCEARVRADQHIVEHAQVAEHAAVLERAREAERRELLGRQAR